MQEYQLKYASKAELEADIEPLTLKPRDAVSVKLSDNTNYVFRYMATVGDMITGQSALNGAQVMVDPDRLVLIEK